jgi:ribosome maturation factor RimP
MGRLRETMAGNSLTPELVSELEAVAGAHGCELLHAEFKGGILRIFLDREAGVGLGHCEAVSKEVSALLDVSDFGRGRYTLEVSSPGLDRQLYRPRDYERFVGRRARVRFRDRSTGRRATVVGELSGYRPDGGGEVDVDVTETKQTLTIPLEDIEVARLVIEI